MVAVGVPVPTKSSQLLLHGNTISDASLMELIAKLKYALKGKVKAP